MSSEDKMTDNQRNINPLEVSVDEAPPLGEITTTSRGFEIVEFLDRYGLSCELQQSSVMDYSPPGSSAVWLGPAGDKRMHLSLLQVKSLIKSLENWAATGSFKDLEKQPVPLGGFSHYWAIAGRVLGDDEDSCGTFGLCTEEEARQLFIDKMIEEEGTPLEELRARIGLSENDSCVLITSVFRSRAPIILHHQSL